ncbi:general odorant-binding protein 19d-like [Culex pipiens pallens]|uniref:general odorant-binding protein 19d-like n=1 Tax=Culex pipiens pallens TaxID=42434 RepID=UPI0019541A32|nr:general odorant-binding protein 19d-like [Culex pipiens pallens]
MNRWQLAVAVVFFLAAHAFAQTDDEVLEIRRNLAQSCKEREGASDGDVEGLITAVEPVTRVQKCLQSCVQQQHGVSDGRRFLKEGYLALMRVVVGTDQLRQRIVEEAADECIGVENEDRCQLAIDIMICVKQALQKRGLRSKE